MVTYGGMSMQPVNVGTGVLIFKDITFKGFLAERGSDTEKGWAPRSGRSLTVSFHICARLTESSRVRRSMCARSMQRVMKLDSSREFVECLSSSQSCVSVVAAVSVHLKV